MNFFRSLRFLIVFFIVTNASAYVVDVINVEGNIHVSKDVVINSIDFTKGVDLNDAQVNEFVKKVYATGLFKDVKVSYADKVLTLKVVGISPLSAGHGSAVMRIRAKTVPQCRLTMSHRPRSSR